MGKNNKARRAAKARSRAKERARARPESQAGPSWGRGPGFPWSAPEDGPLFDPDAVAASAWRIAAQRHGRPSAAESRRRLDQLPEQAAYRGAESWFLEHLDAVWAGGWQPAELRRQGSIGCSGSAGARLVALVIAVDHARRRAETLDPRWVAQVERLNLPATDGRDGWLRRWATGEGLQRDGATEAVLDAMANLLDVPALEPLLPPPGSPASARRGPRPAGGRTDPVLERIRRLLAKAESTSFEAEATALTAKAQQLMTRHAVDAAVLESDPAQRSSPTEVRLPVDAPYADVKSLLLQTVAEAGRCRAVFLPRLGMSTVVGFPDDLAAVELLFTSLLVQAQHALAEAAKHAAAGTRTRSQSYRSAFLVAFAQRIGQRLREINDAVLGEAESEHGSAFLPVLSSMSETLDQWMTERYGETYTAPVRGGYDPAGWSGGRIAADAAQLNFADLPA